MTEQTIPRRAIPWSEVGLDMAVGVVVLVFQSRWLSWAMSRMFHTPFDEFTDNATGAVVPYTRVPEFWMDLGPTVFGLVLIADGLLMCVRRRWADWLALALTTLCTVYNAGYLILSWKQYGLAVISLAAAVFGGYLMTRQWQELRRFRTS